MSEEKNYTFLIEIASGSLLTAEQQALVLSVNSNPEIHNCWTRDEVKSLIVTTTGVVELLPGYIVKRIPL